MTEPWLVNGPIKADNDLTLSAAMREMFAAGVAEGPFAVLGRPGPTGAEMVLWVGEASNPAGFATFIDTGNGRAWIDLVYVQPAQRRGGIGKGLVKGAVRAAQDQGYEQMLTGTLIGDDRMARVLLPLGFAPLATLYGRPLR